MEKKKGDLKKGEKKKERAAIVGVAKEKRADH